MLPLTKGHLSNKDRIVWQKGCPYYRGTTVQPSYSFDMSYNTVIIWIGPQLLCLIHVPDNQ